MARCLRCKAGNEWIDGDVKPVPYAELQALADKWTKYAYDNSGRHPAAADTLDRCARELEKALAASVPPGIARPTGRDG